MKKCFTDKFNLKTGFLNLTASEKYDKFQHFLKGFVAEYFESILNHNNENNSNNLFEDIYFYVGIMIYPSLIKRNIKKKNHVRFRSMYYEWVYKYTHYKLSKLFSDQTLKLIFQHYTDSGEATKMIEQDETMSKSKEAYWKCLERFQKLFQDELFLKWCSKRSKKRSLITKVKI